jgi:hypothetical protein
MSFSVADVAKDLLTFGGAAKVAIGAFAHKAGSWLYAKYQKLAADIKAVEAAAAKKL